LVCLSFDELNIILEESVEYPRLQDVSWIVAEMGVNSYNMSLVSKMVAASVNLTFFKPVIPISEKYEELNTRYMKRFTDTLGFYEANVYDACWLYALAVLDCGTDDSDILKSAINCVAEDYVGITGLCKFDAYGDRTTANFGIYQFSHDDGLPELLILDEWELIFNEGFIREGIH